MTPSRSRALRSRPRDRTAARLVLTLIAAGSMAGAATQARADDGSSWRADHHVHLASADLCRRVGECLSSNDPPAVFARDAVAALDAAHVRRGVVLSCAYLYGLPSLQLAAREVARLTRRENEFTAAEVARYPDRLVGFLAVDPLQPSALAELRYWRARREFVGLKLHFSASAVNLTSRSHRERVAGVFRAAAGWPIVVHIGGADVGAAEAETFIRDVLPSAGSSWVQVAHAGGGLPLSGDHHARVLEAFADHIARDDPATRRVLFDLSYVPAPEEGEAAVADLVRQIRRIGIERFVFGSDFNVLSPRQAVDQLARLGLTEAERAAIREHCAPWACGRSPTPGPRATGRGAVRPSPHDTESP